MSQSISLATMGKFAGPTPRKMVTGQPVEHTYLEHEFPKAEITKIESEDVKIKVDLFSNEVDNNGN